MNELRDPITSNSNGIKVGDYFISWELYDAIREHVKQAWPEYVDYNLRECVSGM